MVARGNMDLHRHSMSGLRVEETEKWGRDTARSRYGEARSPSMKATDATKPQAREDKQAAGYRNEVPVSSWLRGGGESAEGKPAYGRIKPRQ
jgi:hypothetical protein